MRTLTKEEFTKKRLENRVVCKCGCVNYLNFSEKGVCKNCKGTIYRNKKVEFKDKLGKEMRKI